MESLKLEYDNIISQLVKGIFSKKQLIRKFEELERSTLGARKRDKAAIESRSERGYPAPFGYQPPSIREFIEKRTSSIRRQLNGKETGYIFIHRRPGGRLGHLAQGNFGRGRLAMHIMIQGDKNQDKWITKKELQTMVSEWFDSMDREKTGKLNKDSFIKTLPDAFFPSGRKPLGRIPAPYVAEGLFSLADLDEDGMATKQSLTSSFNSLLEKMSTDNSAQINQHSLMIGLRSLIRQ
jgi:hypothetical protein